MTAGDSDLLWFHQCDMCDGVFPCVTQDEEPLSESEDCGCLRGGAGRTAASEALTLCGWDCFDAWQDMTFAGEKLSRVQ